ncbi:tetratricopeptide repeat protein [Vreelandella titanicae]|jgi:type III secretion protein Y|uniref:type III secretion apparatus assembly chaperone SctY n=1 Tax=Halomonadaceae TaxID=28256 RepID=UPI000698DA2B|nr:tetratricopeptide repeat protein [Halomonas sp. KHS3]|tara:strand:+ start:251 stop:613 length:363 start_codon:yes stop_codon:yes gene_type:complete
MSDTADRDAVDLLHLMGHLYLKSGQVQRGLVLLLIATRMAPNHTGVLQALCQGFLASGNGQRALNVLDRLEAAGQQDNAMQLLRSRAHWINGERDTARRLWREYLERRRHPESRQGEPVT